MQTETSVILFRN